MRKRFKIIESNLSNITDSHFVCNAEISTHSTIFDTEFRTTMFDGIYVKVVNDKNYIVGEVHGIQPE